MSESTSYPPESGPERGPKRGIDELLIASALQPDLCRRLAECPEDVFQEFDLTDEHKDILRHPDHRLLGLLGKAVVRQFGASSEGNEGSGGPEGSSEREAPVPAPHAVIPATRLADLLLALTVAPYAQFDGERFLGFTYAVWVNAIPEGADPASIVPPAGAELAGRPAAPLRAVIQMSAAQLPDVAGTPQVGLWASLRQSSNVIAPPPPEASGASGHEPQSEAVQAAVDAVRQAPAHERFERVIDLMRELRGDLIRESDSEGTR